jgi:transcription-repair coupling factor (superfamily II helicase)
VEDLADRLVILYAKRREAVGFTFPKDNDWQMSFEAAFPYQETEDQFKAIEEVKARYGSTSALWTGLSAVTSGYGKTEIAMRAAFKAVMGGKQVAFLAPTTILVEQHFENFLRTL